MKILITGCCGFVGSQLALKMREDCPEWTLIGVDNFIRPGSEVNRACLIKKGVQVRHGDIRQWSDVEAWPEADWLIDAAANPSVMGGVDGKSSSRQIMEHNLIGTLNLLEYCKRFRAGFILLSTSRVYAIEPLSGLKVNPVEEAFRFKEYQGAPFGLTEQGLNEGFSTKAPISLYGASKLASECLALEYGAVYDFPVWINRCGVMAGAGQFGRADQGIYSFWLNSWLQKRPLKYLGFGGKGYQVRDCLHPRDLLALVKKQMPVQKWDETRIYNISGGMESSCSLAQLSTWCENRWGRREVGADPALRAFDIPWVVLDPGLAWKTWQWKAETTLEAILNEIANHAEQHPEWLEISAQP